VNEVAKEAEREQRKSTQTSKDGIHVDVIPKKYAEKRQKDIKGGEYVDYEEVKE
jgi:hypothetical protein|tara:strand:- start:262 stop:423 length:162 start_codon:yes stop_codon:yes gene_type:complete